ncbi:MAG: hypothetical protein KAI39_06145, partial [Desulfobulbaceae bacterium]|nr:hypothetical protein [Desulfobulbaceae bacterium]
GLFFATTYLISVVFSRLLLLTINGTNFGFLKFFSSTLLDGLPMSTLLFIDTSDMEVYNESF